MTEQIAPNHQTGLSPADAIMRDADYLRAEADKIIGVIRVAGPQTDVTASDAPLIASPPVGTHDEAIRRAPR